MVFGAKGRWERFVRKSTRGVKGVVGRRLEVGEKPGDRFGDRPVGFALRLQSSALRGVSSPEARRRVSCSWRRRRTEGGRRCGRAPVADAAQAIPSLHRGVGPLDAAADARRPAVPGPLPVFERLVAPALPGHAVDQAALFERLAESLGVISLVGEIRPARRPGSASPTRRESCTLAGVISACRTNPLSSSTARCAL